MSKIIRLHHDFETRSKADLIRGGTSRYARHPSTQILMCAYAFNDEPVKQWLPCEGEQMPADLRDGLRDPGVVKFAWNKVFEWNIWKHVAGIEIPHNQWRDPMVVAFGLSLPGSLDAAGRVVELPSDKQKLSRGKYLVRKFCTPRKPTKGKPWEWCSRETDPEDWEEFLLYNRQDVEAERAIWRRIRRWDMPAHEWDLWFLDQDINERGIPVNLNVVRNALRVYADVIVKRKKEMGEITGLDNPNSNVQLLPWLKNKGYPFNDLKKGHIARALDDAEKECWDPTVEIESRDYRRVLELRQEVSKSSVKKYQALADATDDDGYIRYTLQFAAAGRTWRWGGRKYQPQNLARPAPYLEKPEVQARAVKDLELYDADTLELFYDKPMDLLSTCVRPVVQAPEGYIFVDADLNAIENRVLGWMADEQKILNVFRKDRDPYVDFSRYMFGGTYEERWGEYKAGNKEKRTLSKPAVLGCGYMLGPGEEKENEETGEIEATGLLGYAWNMGVKLTLEQSKDAVKIWRATFDKVKDFWYEIDRAARNCIRTQKRQDCGPIFFDISGPFMRMGLPSGRFLYYCRPRIQDAMTPWGEVRPTITYEGVNDKNQWARIKTHPGKLTENGDQAISRDILAHGLMLARKRKLDIRLHVHDQGIALVRVENSERALKILEESMAEQPKWAPGLPLAAKGMASKIFIKD